VPYTMDAFLRMASSRSHDLRSLWEDGTCDYRFSDGSAIGCSQKHTASQIRNGKDLPSCFYATKKPKRSLKQEDRMNDELKRDISWARNSIVSPIVLRAYLRVVAALEVAEKRAAVVDAIRAAIGEDPDSDDTMLAERIKAHYEESARRIDEVGRERARVQYCVTRYQYEHDAVAYDESAGELHRCACPICTDARKGGDATCPTNAPDNTMDVLTATTSANSVSKLDSSAAPEPEQQEPAPAMQCNQTGIPGWKEAGITKPDGTGAPGQRAMAGIL